jgi:amino acid transporter/mannitol/fructose-specific phosphotransferase system IIA component (Ntr-type)
MAIPKFARLRKQLALVDIFVISAGAMISSGFFLLPGLAAAQTGPSVVLAYLLAGLLIIPAMLSQAELATAMPRAGGAYYYLDRTLGPLVGTIGGIGTWLALVLKSAFALIGMGAYIALVVDLPLVPTAVAFAVIFAILNISGAKQTSGLLRIFVLGLLVMLGYFLVHGLAEITGPREGATIGEQFAPFLADGIDGLLGAVGLVFVSFVGLTKVASLAEEIENPDRNIPLGMTIALLTVVTIYVLGVFIMVSVLGTETLSLSLTPVADTANAFTKWIPSRISMWLMVGAAVLAFASMANAGILAASRYPLAMARDKIFPDYFAITGHRDAPVSSILLTVLLLVLMLTTLDIVSVAKLASSLQLLLFGLVNLAVVVMRESGLDSYDPGFRSPLYPWPQLVGIFLPLVLVAEMGWLPVLFTLGVTALAFGWYTYYARPRIARDGAIFHVFERLGRRRFAGLDRELRDIMKEKGLRAEDPFDHLVAQAEVIDHDEACGLDAVVHDACLLLSRRVPASCEELEHSIAMGIETGGAPVAHGAALLHARLPVLEESALVLVRCRGGVIAAEGVGEVARQAAIHPVHAVFVMVSGEGDPGRHLRILAQLAGRVEDESFIPEWLTGEDEQELKETLLRDDRFLSIRLDPETPVKAWIGQSLQELDLPEGLLVVLIRRQGRSIVPQWRTVLRSGDRLTILGEPGGLAELSERLGGKAA